jgi:hypothetical protein
METLTCRDSELERNSASQAGGSVCPLPSQHQRALGQRLALWLQESSGPSLAFGEKPSRAFSSGRVREGPQTVGGWTRTQHGEGCVRGELRGEPRIAQKLDKVPLREVVGQDCQLTLQLLRWLENTSRSGSSPSWMTSFGPDSGLVPVAALWYDDPRSPTSLRPRPRGPGHADTDRAYVGA